MLPPWCARPARCAPGTASPPGLPSLPAPSLGHLGSFESSGRWLGPARVVQGGVYFEFAPGMGSVEQTCGGTLFYCCPSVLC